MIRINCLIRPMCLRQIRNHNVDQPTFPLRKTMQHTITTIVFYLMLAFSIVATAGDRKDVRASRESLESITLSSSGFSLEMSTSLMSPSKPADTWVSIALRFKEDTGAEYLYWRVDRFSLLHYHPDTKGYYAMVKVMKDRLLIFSTWNAHYCLVDRQTGRVLKCGDGDDVLKEYDGFVPLKLTINTLATCDFLTGPAAVKDKKERLKLDRQTSAVIRCEAVPALRQYRFYVIQFKKPVSIRKPLFVIAWKGTILGSSSFDFRQPVARIGIHGHVLRPSPTNEAVYLLQPDYSLQKLDLTEKEVADLFLHITDSELRNDKRVASIFKKEAFDEKELDRLDKMKDDLAVFPPSPLWEHKVSLHLKMVEPSEQSSGSDEFQKDAISKPNQ